MEARAGVEPTYTDLQSTLVPYKSNTYARFATPIYRFGSDLCEARIIGVIDQESTEK